MTTYKVTCHGCGVEIIDKYQDCQARIVQAGSSIYLFCAKDFLRLIRRSGPFLVCIQTIDPSELVMKKRIKNL